MTTLLEEKLRKCAAVCITDAELEVILGVGRIQRYNQVKRAIKRGDLIHVRRGLYCLGERLAATRVHPFELAQKIYWPSYISLESALSYHGLIPEAVYNITSVTSKRSTLFKTPFGKFMYAKLPKNNLFTQVSRISENKVCFYIAEPWKAICDYVYCYKKSWKGLDPLINDLRIDVEDLPKTTASKLSELNNYYQSRRVTIFLQNIMRELKL